MYSMSSKRETWEALRLEGIQCHSPEETLLGRTCEVSPRQCRCDSSAHEPTQNGSALENFAKGSARMSGNSFCVQQAQQVFRPLFGPCHTFCSL